MPYSDPAGLLSKDKMPSGFSWHLFTFILIIFIIVIFGYLGLEFGYKPFLRSEIGALDAQIQVSSSGYEADAQKNLVDFYSRITNLKSLLQQHPRVSKIFAFLENATNVKVTYTAVDLSVAQKAITIDGFAESRAVLASQLLAYESYAGVSQVQLQNDAQFGNAVRFKVRITLDPQFLIAP